MRILQVIPFFTPQMGGSAQIAYQMTCRLSLSGHEVTVLTSDYSMQASSFPNGTFDLIALPTLFTAGGWQFSSGLIPWGKRNIGKYDIIHLHLFRTFQNAQLHPIIRQSHKPYVLSAHGTLPIIVERKLPKRIYDLLFGKRILRDAARCLAVSPVEVEQYRQFGVPHEKIVMILNGLDLAEFEALPERGSFRQTRLPSAHPEDPLILYLGRIHKRKNVDLLIQAFHILQKDLRNAQLAIIGPDEGEIEKLKRLAGDLQVKEVHFLEPLYGKARLAALQDSSLVVLPAAYEIFGLVPFEGILCGTPVIVSDDCGAGRLIQQADIGYTCQLGDVQDLAQKMRDILASPEEALAKVRRGQAYIRQNLDWDVLITQLIGVYQTVIGEAEGDKFNLRPIPS